MLEITADDRDRLLAHAHGSMRIQGRAAADDLVQEALMRAHKYRDKYEERGQKRTWLIRIMRNVFLNKLNQTKRNNKRLDKYHIWAQHIETNSAYQVHFDKQYEISIQEALDSLPSLMKQTLLLRAEGLEYLEIAEKMNCPVGTVMSRLLRARGKMIEATGLTSMQDYWNGFPIEEEEYVGQTLQNKSRAKVEIRDDE